VDVIAVLVWISVAAAAVTVLGILAARNVFDRLHYLGIVSSVGTVCACAAVAVREGWSQGGIKAILIGLTIVFMNPVLTHATARAARMRRYGRLMPEDWKRVRFLEGNGNENDGPRQDGEGDE
jgi:monovalent cation/proton antiporter MnhG/PhaG subunit